MLLPSGRCLTYPRARLHRHERFGEINVSFTFLDTSGDIRAGKMYHERRGKEGGAFGGLLLENATQAICRDIFAEAMPRLEAAGYTIVAHTHDEYVCEAPEGFGSLQEFLRLITVPPAWAPDMPIAAKARLADRLIEIPEPGRANTTAADYALDNAAMPPDEEDEDGIPDAVELDREIETVERSPETLAELRQEGAGEVEAAPEGPLDDAAEPVEPIELPGPEIAPEPIAHPGPPVAPLCAHCRRDPPDGQERLTPYGGAWLHPDCETDFLRAYLASGLSPHIASATFSLSALPHVPAQDPPYAPPPGNGHANGGTNDNGHHADAGSSSPGDNWTPRPPEDDYRRGEDPGPRAGPAVTNYLYKDANGRLYMRVTRTASKTFPTSYWSNGEWISGWPAKVIPYRLPELLAAPADALVLICEGEKDVETAVRHGFVATTKSGRRWTVAGGAHRVFPGTQAGVRRGRPRSAAGGQEGERARAHGEDPRRVTRDRAGDRHSAVPRAPGRRRSDGLL